MKKERMIELLRAFVAQRSGIDYSNYGDRASFLEDYRRILRDGKDARQLINDIELKDGISVDDIAHEMTHRLMVSGDTLEYTTGQYFPVEYRAAVCRVCSSVLWNYYRDGSKDGDGMRAMFKRRYGRGMASRWFN